MRDRQGRTEVLPCLVLRGVANDAELEARGGVSHGVGWVSEVRGVKLCAVSAAAYSIASVPAAPSTAPPLFGKGSGRLARRRSHEPNQARYRE